MRNYNMQQYNMPRNNMPLCAMPEPRMPEPRMTNRLENRTDGCSCDRETNNCDAFPIGMAYVPWQKFQNLFEPEKGFQTGTIFIELDKPFLGKGAFRR